MTLLQEITEVNIYLLILSINFLVWPQQGESKVNITLDIIIHLNFNVANLKIGIFLIS